MFRKLIFLWLCLQLFCLVSAQEPMTLVQSTDTFLEIEFNNPNFSIGKVTNFNNAYSRIDSKVLNSSDYIGVKKAPVLPYFSKFINLQDREIAYIECTIIRSHEIKNIKILPYFDSSKSEVPVENPEIYGKDLFFPEQVYSFSPAMIMRGTKLSNLTITPFSYNPAKKLLKVCDKVLVKVFLKEGNTPVSNKATTNTNRIINKLSLNGTRELEQNLPRGSYVYIYSTTESNEAMVISLLQPLFDWKHRQGYEVVVVNMSTIGTTSQSLKNYLTEAYNTWANPPEFVCLVGDSHGNFAIPTYSYNDNEMASDFDYTLIEGNDFLPEMFIGRLSVESLSQLAVVVNKILKYESQPFIAEDDWYEKTLLVGDPTDSGNSTIVEMDYIQGLISQFNPESNNIQVYQTPFVNQISSAINTGVAAYFYRGFASYSGWTTNDTFELTNGYKLPFVCQITCFSGVYQTSPACQTEAMLRAGTVTNPQGAVAAIGSSYATHTCINNILTGGVAWGIYKDELPTIGEALVRGKLALVESYPTNPANFVEIYSKANNLMGDPGMVLWTRKPAELNLQYPGTIVLGTNQVEVTASSEGQYVPNVRVCLWKGEEIFISGVTDTQGYLRLFLPTDYTTGEIKVTATLQNHIPVLGTISISSANTSAGFVDFEEATPFKSGTNISFKVRIRNFSTTTINNVNGNISSANDYLTFNNSNVSFGNIPANSESVSQTFITGSISGSCPDNTELITMLNLTSGAETWPCAVVLNAVSSGLSVESMVLIGPNGNYINPGQTGSVTLYIKNIGSTQVNSMDLVLKTNDPNIAITDSLSFISALAPGQTIQLSENPFQIAPSTAIITGSILNFTLTGNESNTNQTIDLGIQIGNAGITDPTGPDQYGYYCYDDEDAGYTLHPQYNWIEISPAHGGNGTIIPCEDTDIDGSGQTTTIDTPFQYRFYCNSYDKMSICTNGFIVPGASNCFDWMNWPIPGPMVPRGIIAPFWDDLLTSNSQLCYYYDAQQHQFIVEWSDFLNRFDNLPATFQVIISDPAYDATTLGDSKIKFQYLEVHNNDVGSYEGDEVDHGEYSTIGIADKRNSAGLQYTYSNSYPVTAKILESEMALLFSGPSTPPQNTFIIIQDLSYIETIGNNNNIINNHEIINMNLSLKNIGLSLSGIINAHLRSTTDFLTITQANTTLNSLDYNQISSSDNLQFTVANNCPNGFQTTLVLQITYNGGEKEFDIPIQVQAPNLILSGYQYIDEDNFLEPDEDGNLILIVKNDSDILLSNCDLSLNFNNPSVSISPDECNLQQLAPGTDYSWNVSLNIPESVQAGEVLLGTITAIYNQFYQQTYSFELIIGVPELIMAEDFESPYTSDFFAIYASPIPAEYINETGTEMKMSFVNNYLPSFIMTKFYQTKNYKKFFVTFKYYNQGGNFPVVFGYGRDFTDYLTLWSDMDNTAVAESISFICDNLNLNTINQRFIWLLAIEGGYTPQFAVFDDLKVYGYRKPKGTVSGQITLNGGEGDVTEVSISDSTIIVHPDANGHYSIEIIEGPATIKVNLPGYESKTSQLMIIPDQVLTADFTLQYLIPPTNLTHSIQDNHLILNWNTGQTVRTNSRKTNVNSNRLVFSHFKITLNYNSAHYTYFTTNPHYERNMYGNGHYMIYVTAVYSTENSTNIESDTSNVLEFDYVGIEDNTSVPKEYTMSQNYPNPFNPTTRIDFALPERNTNCTLSVYNIKGELIKFLTSGIPLEPGNYSFTWDGDNKNGNKVGSGIYFFKLKTDKKEFVRKAVLLK